MDLPGESVEVGLRRSRYRVTRSAVGHAATQRERAGGRDAGADEVAPSPNRDVAVMRAHRLCSAVEGSLPNN